MSSSASLNLSPNEGAKKQRNPLAYNHRRRSRRRNQSDGEIDHYKEIDERMSRNSLEYPEEQARYVKRWVDNNYLATSDEIDINLSSLSDSDSSFSVASDRELYGNVIGIRGYPRNAERPQRKEYLWAPNDDLRERKQSSNERTNFNKLRFDHLHLQSQVSRLRSNFESSMNKLKKILRRRDQEIEFLRRLTGGARADSNMGPKVRQTGAESEQKLQRVIAELKTQLKEKDHSGIMTAEQLRLEAQRDKLNLEHELESARKKLNELSTKPDAQMIAFLRNENERLKAQAKADSDDLHKLSDEYSTLEMRLKSLMVDQKDLSNERQEELAKVQLELCRLQVYQPRLEQILETERAIKLELQGRVKQLESELAQISQERDRLREDLSTERTKSRLSDSNEVQIVQLELQRWQEKFHILRREKSDCDETIRDLKSRLGQVDHRHERQLELSNEESREQFEDLRREIVKLEQERNKLKCELDSCKQMVGELRSENEEFVIQVHEITRELELAQTQRTAEQSTLKRLELDGVKVNKLSAQLRESEAKLRRSISERQIEQVELEKYKRDIEQLRQRLELQLKSYEELKESKEQELSRLRINLNFEQYQRQIALESIEKELKSSVRELEAMKIRFSGKRTLLSSDPSGRQQSQSQQQQQQQNTSSQITSLTTSSDANSDGSSRVDKKNTTMGRVSTNRVHFNGPKKSQTCDECKRIKDPTRLQDSIEPCETQAMAKVGSSNSHHYRSSQRHWR